MGCHSRMDVHHVHHKQRACILCVFVCAICSTNMHVCRGHQTPNSHDAEDFFLPDLRINLKDPDRASYLGAKTKRDVATLADDTPTQIIDGVNVRAVVLQRLFNKYGQEDRLTFEGFEHLLESLGLADIHFDDHSIGDHKVWSHPLHADHEHSDRHYEHSKQHSENSQRQPTKRDLDPMDYNLTSGVYLSDEAVGDARNEYLSMPEETSGSNGSLLLNSSTDSLPVASHIADLAEKCLTPIQVLRLHHFNQSESLSIDQFVSLCPTLIFQLDVHSCSHSHHSHSGHTRDGQHAVKHIHDRNHTKHHGDHNETEHYVWKSPSVQVWGYSLLACLVISAVGLVCVCIIPIMHRVVYNHMLQLLVGLAIGSMTGDALLHLLPHAFVPDHESHGSHNSSGNEPMHDAAHNRMVWIGLTALSGIYVFFVVEQFVRICSERRRGRHSAPVHLHTDAEMEKAPMKPTPVSFPLSPLAAESGDAPSGVAGGAQVRLGVNKHLAGVKLSQQGAHSTSCEEMLMIVHTNKDVRTLSNTAHDEVHKHCDPRARDSAWQTDKQGHNHSHKVPGSVASVAWMVIAGDGFHNFADGLAIGSAFASSLTGGLSTSIAVFCHELPHELGDFAMLMNAGMSAKQALVYNCVSSVLCIVGMVVGVAVGNLEAADSWIFAAIAGLFLYIALVDMLPEMKSVRPKTGEHPFVHFALQISGMLVGAAIMLVIAVFEDKMDFS